MASKLSLDANLSQSKAQYLFSIRNHPICWWFEFSSYSGCRHTTYSAIRIKALSVFRHFTSGGSLRFIWLFQVRILNVDVCCQSQPFPSFCGLMSWQMNSEYDDRAAGTCNMHSNWWPIWFLTGLIRDVQEDLLPLNISDFCPLGRSDCWEMISKCAFHRSEHDGRLSYVTSADRHGISPRPFRVATLGRRLIERNLTLKSGFWWKE
jgi:hypothetical protein